MLVQQRDQRRGASTPALHDERVRAEVGGDLASLAQTAHTEDDAGRGCELEAQPGRSHSATSSGKSAWYFTLRRGSAIHDSTVSRHFA